MERRQIRVNERVTRMMRMARWGLKIRPVTGKALHNALDDPHLALHRLILAPAHVQGGLDVVLAEDDHGLLKGLAGFVEHDPHMGMTP